MNWCKESWVIEDLTSSTTRNSKGAIAVKEFLYLNKVSKSTKKAYEKERWVGEQVQSNKVENGKDKWSKIYKPKFKN